MIECNIIFLRRFHHLAEEILSDFCNSPLADNQTHSRHDQPVQWIAQTFGSSELKCETYTPGTSTPKVKNNVEQLSVSMVKDRSLAAFSPIRFRGGPWSDVCSSLPTEETPEKYSLRR